VAELKGLKKPVKLKADMAEFCGVSELPRTEITKRLWDYIKANGLQTKSANGKPENAGKFIVADAKLLKVFKNTNSTISALSLTGFLSPFSSATTSSLQVKGQ